MNRKIALEILLQKVSALNSFKINVSKSENCVLASPVFSQIDLPSFDKSAMDGFAICEDETQETLQVVDFTAAGESPSSKLSKGKAVKILTGAPVPKNAWKIIPKELVSENENTIVLNCQLKEAPNNICSKGEDIPQGQLLYPKGTLIDIRKKATLVFAGVNEVEVFSKPRISVITTGSEVVSFGDKRGKYQVYNANAELLFGLLNKELDTADFSHVADEYSLVEAEFNQKFEKSDLLIFTGGASVGKFDYVKKMLKSLGAEELFSGLSIRPARPTACYLFKGKLIFSLPGNPVAVFLAYHLFVLPVIYKMQSKVCNLFREVEITGKLQVRLKDRENFVPIKYNDKKIEILDYNGPADLYHISLADGFLVVPPETKIVEGKAKVLLF